jgi:dipeptidyl aminopeptidase/acylaminoacyl peptidase
LAALLAALVLAVGCESSSSPVAPTPTPPPTTPGRFDVTFQGAGISLGGVLYRPDITNGTHPALIVLHGWLASGSNGAALVEPRARRFSEEGYVALAMSMRGWPPSSGSDDCGLRQPDDVAEAAAWLARQPGVDGDRIGVVGFSQGGQVALLAGARGARLRAIVAYYPVTDVALWKTTTSNADIPGYITSICEPGGTTQRSPRAAAGAITPPVLLVHGDADTRVPTEQSLLMDAALDASGRSGTLFLVPGAQHGFNAGGGERGPTRRGPVPRHVASLNADRR